MARTKKQENDYSNKIVTIEVAPGRNETIAVSVDALNCIRAPFDNPRVHSVDKSLGIKIDGRNVYISVSKVSSVYISTKAGDIMYPITLVPNKMPPVTVFLQSNGIAEAADRALAWEKKGSYQDSLKNLIVALIKNDLPNGFTAKNLTDAALIQGYEVMPGLMLTIQNEFVGVNLLGQKIELTNTTRKAIEIQENQLYFNGVLAVALEDYNRAIEPRQSATAYLILKNSVN